MRALLLVAVVAGGCADLPPLAASCGNGILEPGEDCDVPGARCVACGWQCGSGGDCSDIPAPRDGSGGAYACGADGLCHAPGGVIGGETSGQSFAASSLMVSDVDGDRYGDAVGLSIDSIVTRYGDRGGQLATERSTLTPARGGAAATADIDADGRRDLLVPARDGLVAYTSGQGVVSPFAFAVELPGGIQIVPHAVIPIDGKRIFVLADDVTSSTHLVGAIVDITSTQLSLVNVDLCDLAFRSDSFDASTVDYFDTGAAVGKPSVAIAFIATNNDGVKEGCALGIIENGSGSGITYTVTASAPVGAPPVRPVFVDMGDAGGCPSVIISGNDAAGITRYDGALSGGKCIEPGTMSTLPHLPGPASDVVIGRVPLVPAVASAAPDALVTASGIYTVNLGTGTAKLMYGADRPLRSIASGDINADARRDAIATGDDQTIDVLTRVVAPDGFLRQRLATNAVPAFVTIGDFDGNGADDIAYVEPQPTGDSLQIAYGTLDHPLPAVVVATFAQVTRVIRVAFTDSTDPADRIDDLAVVDRRTIGARSYPVVAGFHGSPDRAMIPYFDPRGANPSSTFRAVTGGRFVPAVQHFDLFAVEVPDPGATTPAMLWRLAGEDRGALSLSVGPLISATAALPVAAGAIGDCQQQASAYCVEGGMLLTWPGTATTDRVIGIDPTHGQTMLVDPAMLVTQTMPVGADMLGLAPLCDPGGTCVAPGAALRAAFPQDLDGDGAPELVVAFGAPADPADRTGVFECTVGAQLACRDLLHEATGLPGGCRDAAPGTFAPRSSDLAVLCDRSIYRVTRAGAAFAATRLFDVPMDAGEIAAIQTGDVDGDAVADLLVIATDSTGVRRLHVYRQLTSREVSP